MNLLFRKNFREGANKSGGGGGSKLQSKSNRTKRSRETGGGINNNEEIHYRTHLFFAPSRGGYEPPEEKCSGISGFSNQLPSTAQTSASSPFGGEVEAPQPLVDRRPSFSLLRWNQSIKGRNENIANLTVNQSNQQQQQANQLFSSTSFVLPTSTTMSTAPSYAADRQGLKVTPIVGKYCHYASTQIPTHIHAYIIVFIIVLIRNNILSFLPVYKISLCY